MQYGQIAGLAKPVSRLIQGTAPYDPGRPEEMLRSLDTALALGYNTFDTAENYGPEREQLFGRWLRERGVRDEVVIVAKGAHHQVENGQIRQRVTPEDIAADIDGTMANMQVDFLDLYVLHRDDPSVPVGPIVEALNRHQREGRIGAFGGSNWTFERIRDANAYAKAQGLSPFQISSPNFSLAEQIEEPWKNCVSISGAAGEEARRFYARERTAVFAWSSLASGFFSGRFRRDNLEEMAGSYWSDLCIRCYCGEPNFQRLDRVQELASEKGASVAQVALAYVLSQPFDAYALVFCASRDEFTADVEALGLRLTPQEVAWLDLRADKPS